MLYLTIQFLKKQNKNKNISTDMSSKFPLDGDNDLNFSAQPRVSASLTHGHLTRLISLCICVFLMCVWGMWKEITITIFGMLKSIHKCTQLHTYALAGLLWPWPYGHIWSHLNSRYKNRTLGTYVQNTMKIIVFFVFLNAHVHVRVPCI